MNIPGVLYERTGYSPYGPVGSHYLLVHHWHPDWEAQHPTRKPLGRAWEGVVDVLRDQGPATYPELVVRTGYDRRTTRRAIQSAKDRGAVAVDLMDRGRAKKPMSVFRATSGM